MDAADDIDKVADQAVQRYQALHDATSKLPEKPGPGDYNPELEQIWAAIRRIDNGGAGSGGGGGTFLPAFEIHAIDTANVQVRPGAVANTLATGTATNIDLSGESDGTYKFYIDVTIDNDGVVTAVAVAYASSTPADSTYHAYLLIGTVAVAGGVIGTINNVRPFSKAFQVCDRDPADAATTPGTYNFGIS